MADDDFNPDRMLRETTGKGMQEWNRIQRRSPKDPMPGQVPLFPELEAAMPHHLARSSLFSPIRRGRRSLHDKTKLFSRDDVALYFSGKQLDMADNDVYLELLRVASGRLFGESVPVSRYAILQSLGRSTGKANYKWLHESIYRLTTATLAIEAPKYKAAFHLIDGFELDEETGDYSIRIHPEVRKLLARGEYGFISLERRRALSKRIDLAKWMQNYVCSHQRGPSVPVTLTKLQRWAGLADMRPDKFRTAVSEALAELERVGEITAPLVTDSKASWSRI